MSRSSCGIERALRCTRSVWNAVGSSFLLLRSRKNSLNEHFAFFWTETPLEADAECCKNWFVKRDDLSQASHEELIDLVLASHERLQDVEQQLRWFKKQLFGAKSERRLVEEPSSQLSLGEGLGETTGTTDPTAP